MVAPIKVIEIQESGLGNESQFHCLPNDQVGSGLLLGVGCLGGLTNLFLILVILLKSNLRRWSQGLVFHHALVDFLRSALLIPLGVSILGCQPITKCSLVETSFLVLVTASTINLLTTVLNDAPVLPDDNEEDAIPILLDSPQCVFFGIFIIWFASITINLGPTFLSGTMAANSNFRPREPSCPLVQGPYRHYILNLLWISINLICILLTIYHLLKLYRYFSQTSEDALRVATLVTSILNPEEDNDLATLSNATSAHTSTGGIPTDATATAAATAISLAAGAVKKQNGRPKELNGTAKKPNGTNEGAALHNSCNHNQSLFSSPTKPRILYADPEKVKIYLNKVEREGIERVKMFLIITLAYLIFWGPLFLVTLFNYGWELQEGKQSIAHEVTLHVALVHSFVNPALFLVLHRGLRQASIEILCFCCTAKTRMRAIMTKRRNEAKTRVASANIAFMRRCSTEDLELSASENL
ncbi:uncharacterized protein LOC111702868 isoform X2 [Eurytemora carolleeae]|uniref:uncharacterized protein LOC111702868 isoform X2 n=1 Tax=Eurytemora carolleeae TaxID=1294199 RepID=UPI000C77A4B4|nr:uncharacterized protein LOC111702868 isoform X2 [Eurytemora carolleeae]|eukprot:XP_023330423.1 uncharacterized protein LOC111702868 isoform X2 [Eurytemora affinis]